jgi:4-amino-4-deoxy-L-arabinose transferase-like glycosyltransferase
MTNDTPLPPPEQEPTVLDLYKSVTRDWASFFNFVRSLWDARRREEMNRALTEEAHHEAEEPQVEFVFPVAETKPFPWRSTLAVFLALFAQYLLEPGIRNTVLAALLFLLAIGLGIWALVKDEWNLPALPSPRQMADRLHVRGLAIFAAIGFGLYAFMDFGEGVFSLRNVSAWTLAVFSLCYGLWLSRRKPAQSPPQVEAQTGEITDASFPESQEEPRKPNRKFWQFSRMGDDRVLILSMSREQTAKLLWAALVLAVFGLVVFFRTNRLGEVPSEPFSDHAEKILDIYDITQGQYGIFFPRNTGREAFQMYWTLLIAKIFGTGLSFISLKLGTAILGILTLPFIYLLGKEFGGPRAGLFALFLFGIAYWPNVISRIGLRFPLYPLFVAPTLLYLTRGLRTRNRNDFILSGLFLGLGLHGYSPFRIMPFVILAAFAIYLLHPQSKGTRRQAIWWLAVIVIVSLFVFLPLLRYWIDHPDLFSFRAFSRLGSIETPLPGPAWQIFLSNLKNGLLMFNWDDGEIWVNSLPHRPALDVATGALFVLGIALLIARIVRQRDWRDILLLVSIPLLLMPSVLSLAFPGENPALNRAGGAAVAAILVSALALDGLITGFGSGRTRTVIAWSLAAVMLGVSAYQNYDLVFRQFDQNFRLGAWNTSEMGKIISEFRQKHGQTDTVWIVPFPHWVDTRLPGVWAGIPNRDFALWPENFAGTLDMPAPKLFMFRQEDVETRNALKQLYPNGALTRHTSAAPGKDFMIFFVK